LQVEGIVVQKKLLLSNKNQNLSIYRKLSIYSYVFIIGLRYKYKNEVFIKRTGINKIHDAKNKFQNAKNKLKVKSEKQAPHC
jgi:hypothetical protein